MGLSNGPDELLSILINAASRRKSFLIFLITTRVMVNVRLQEGGVITQWERQILQRCLESVHYTSTQMEVSSVDTGLGTSQIATLAVDRGTSHLIYDLQTLMQQSSQL